MNEPTPVNLQCADVILRRNNLDALNGWHMLRRDIAIALDLAESEERKSFRKVIKQLFSGDGSNEQYDKALGDMLDIIGKG